MLGVSVFLLVANRWWPWDSCKKSLGVAVAGDATVKGRYDGETEVASVYPYTRNQRDVIEKGKWNSEVAYPHKV